MPSPLTSIVSGLDRPIEASGVTHSPSRHGTSWSWEVVVGLQEQPANCESLVRGSKWLCANDNASPIQTPCNPRASDSGNCYP